MRKLLAALALVAVPLFAPPAKAAEFSRLENGAALIEGVLEEGDGDRFTEFLYGGPVFNILLLNSDGGMIREAKQIADLIHAFDFMQTGVSSGDSCVSACVLIFAAGHARWLMDGGSIGVHSASRFDQSEDGMSLAATVAFARQLSAWGASPAVVGKLVSTPGHEVTWLDHNDLEGWVNFAEQPAD